MVWWDGVPHGEWSTHEKQLGLSVKAGEDGRHLAELQRSWTWLIPVAHTSQEFEMQLSCTVTPASLRSVEGIVSNRIHL